MTIATVAGVEGSAKISGIASLGILLVFTLSEGLNGQPERPEIPIRKSHSWMDVVSGDFNGDGFPDLIVLGLRGEDKVFEGDGSGGFTPGPGLPLGERHRPQVVDLDADGLDDLVSTSFDVLVGLQIVYGGRDAGLLAWNVETPGVVLNLTVRDLDGDGLPDGVVSFEDPVTRTTSVSRIPGDSTFPFETLEPLPEMEGAPFVLAGDLNGDGAVDLAGWRWGWGRPHLVIREGLGGGEFSLADSEVSGSLNSPGGVKQSSAVATDFDRDGSEEILLYSGSQVRQSLLFAVDWTDESGYTVNQLSHFITHSGLDEVHPFTEPWTKLDQVDIDADGWPDALLLAGFTDRIIVLRNSGRGTLDFERCEIELSAEATSFTCGDFNADGELDIASVLPIGGRVELVFSAFKSCKVSRPCLNLDRSFASEATEALHVADWTAAEPGAEILAIGGGRARILSFKEGDLFELGSFRVPGVIQSLGAGDLDQNGTVDFATSRLDSDTIDLFFLDDGGEADARRRSLLIGTNVNSLVVDDVDGDALSDLVFTSGTEETVGVLLGGGGGEFQPPVSFPVETVPTALAVGDVTGDDMKDLVVSLKYRILVFEGLRERRMFADPRVFIEPVTNPRSTGPPVRVDAGVRIADLDGDGENELIVATAKDSIVVFFDVRGGTPRSWKMQEFAGFDRTTSLHVADFDGDGRVEAVAAQPETRTFTIVRGVGRHMFQWESFILDQLGPGPAEYVLGSGNLGSDGLRELVVADPSNRRMAILRSDACYIGPHFLRGDTNGDGDRNLSDAIGILTHLFAGNTGLACLDAADVDDDGDVVLADGVFLLNHLFGGSPGPATPSDACGPDATQDSITCAEHSFCAR